MAQVRGSFSADMLHSHPLSHERAQQLQGYALKARQYYIPGQINPQAGMIAVCNAIYCINGGVVRIQYLLNNKIVHQHSTKFPALQARGRQPFTIPLKAGQYNNVRLIPEYVQ